MENVNSLSEVNGQQPERAIVAQVLLQNVRTMREVYGKTFLLLDSNEGRLEAIDQSAKPPTETAEEPALEMVPAENLLWKRDDGDPVAIHFLTGRRTAPLDFSLSPKVWIVPQFTYSTNARRILPLQHLDHEGMQALLAVRVWEGIGSDTLREFAVPFVEKMIRSEENAVALLDAAAEYQFPQSDSRERMAEECSRNAKSLRTLLHEVQDRDFCFEYGMNHAGLVLKKDDTVPSVRKVSRAVALVSWTRKALKRMMASSDRHTTPPMF